MISSSIRAYNIQGSKYPSIFLYQNTTTGLFQLSEVEAEIREALQPLELLSLQLTNELVKITRIEVHALSGISIELCDEVLETLQYFGLVKLTNYDPEVLNRNLDRINKEIGDFWLNKSIYDLTTRKLLKQYELTEEGQISIKKMSKTVRKTTDLSIVLTGTPFYLFYDKIDLKTDSFEYIEMERNLVKYILGHAEQHSKFSGIKPLSIASNSVLEGKEVSNSQFWITIEGDSDQHLDDVSYNMYLTSTSFERWTNPEWNSKLRSYLPDFEYVEDIVIKSMSETFMMVEDVIEEGLKLSDDKMTWILSVDLEMQKLIYNALPDPINKVKSEIKLRLPDSKWKTVILLQLEPWDELGEKSLTAGRFHSIASRKGFTLEEGYLDYQEMMQSWGKKVNRQGYLEILETLVEFKCLIPRESSVKSIIVDVDDVISFDRRGRQKWLFNRLREIENIISVYEITYVEFMASQNAQNRVDEAEEFQNWVDQGKIKIVETETPGVPEVVAQARSKKVHYLGFKKISKKGKEQEYARTLEPKITKKRVSIPGLEPFYDWRHENVFEKMYEVYYE